MVHQERTNRSSRGRYPHGTGPLRRRGPHHYCGSNPLRGILRGPLRYQAYAPDDGAGDGAAAPPQAGDDPDEGDDPHHNQGFFALGPYEVLSELKDIAARDGVSCACGAKGCSVEVHGSAVDLVCPACGGRLRLPGHVPELAVGKALLPAQGPEQQQPSQQGPGYGPACSAQPSATCWAPPTASAAPWALSSWHWPAPAAWTAGSMVHQERTNRSSRAPSTAPSTVSSGWRKERSR